MKTFIGMGLTLILASGLSAPSALAQSSHYATEASLFQSSDPFKNVDINAGFNLTVPLGAKSSKSQYDKARFGLKLSLTQPEYTANKYRDLRLNGDLLELGFNFDGTPNFMMSGHDVYTPIFGTLHADETSGEDSPPQTKSGGSGTAILGIVAVGTLGTLVLLNEVADDFNDCLRDIFADEDPKCN